MSHFSSLRVLCPQRKLIWICLSFDSSDCSENSFVVIWFQFRNRNGKSDIISLFTVVSLVLYLILVRMDNHLTSILVCLKAYLSQNLRVRKVPSQATTVRHYQLPSEYVLRDLGMYRGHNGSEMLRLYCGSFSLWGEVSSIWNLCVCQPVFIEVSVYTYIS